MVETCNLLPREMDTICFLDIQAIKASISIDGSYQSEHSPSTDIGPALLGVYYETWMNLLDCKSILDTNDV